VLGYESGDAIDSQRPFGDLGLDSLGAVELRNRLSRVLGQRIPATLVFDYPTVAEVAQFLRSRLRDVAPPRPAIDVELDSLERLLATIDTPEEQERVNARLGRLLTATASSAEATVTDTTITEKIQSGTAEEIFDLLDRELTP
jgi:polyene macrolide polyketide synthase/pimaricinolide synthase PimS1